MLALDAQFEALSNGRRRRLLVALAEANPQSLDHAYADQPLTREYQIEMYHVHLPKLAELGLIDWDRETDRITKGAAFEEIRPLIENCRREVAERSER